jgi:serine/threonine protein phosphatase PrpC
MCVLSRGGRAVVMNQMHRLDNEAERRRIREAGGTVLNSRVCGILAVSRAFGDTEFKGEELTADKINGRLLIAEPEVFSEIITPMTEFAIIATDGLWDV